LAKSNYSFYKRNGWYCKEIVKKQGEKKNKMKKELYIIDDDLIFRMIVSKTINKMDSSLVINQCENGAIGLNMLKGCQLQDYCTLRYKHASY
jgi:hypothetical protein